MVFCFAVFIYFILILFIWWFLQCLIDRIVLLLVDILFRPFQAECDLSEFKTHTGTRRISDSISDFDIGDHVRGCYYFMHIYDASDLLGTIHCESQKSCCLVGIKCSSSLVRCGMQCQPEFLENICIISKGVATRWT